jgi:hypothetical protein
MEFRIELHTVEQQSIERESVLARELSDLQLALVGGGSAGVIIG